MSSSIKIKRSEVSGNPATLGAGELAYSGLADNGVNGGDRLYVGMGTETAGNAVNHVVIGGKYFTDMITAATAANTASALVKRDGSGDFTANMITANLTGNASTATSAATWTTGRDLSLTGDATATLAAVDGSVAVSAALTLANTAVTAGSYGSGTAIPTFTVDSKGRLTAAGTVAISSSLSLAADTGSSTAIIGTDTVTFAGGTGIASVLTTGAGTDTITFNIDSTVATLTGAQTLTNKTLTTPVLGVATATSINKLAITAPATGSTLTIADGKTLTASNTLTFTGTDLSSVAFGTGGTVVYTTNKLSVHAATTSAELAGIISDETGTGSLVFASTPTLVTPVLGVATATSINKLTITAPTTSATLTLVTGSSLITAGAFALTLTSTAATNVTLPTTGTLATLAGTETLTNKTLSAGATWNGNTIGVAYGGTGTATGSITGTGALTFTAGGTNTNVILAPNGTGTVDVSTKRITGLAEPTSSTDAATKNYVDVTVQGLDPKASVKAATTANITLSAPQTVDGISLIAGDRVLVKDQTAPAENGIYIVAAGAWTRATDADAWTDLPSAYVFAETGTVNADIGYLCTVDQGGTLGTTAITFQQFTGAGSITAGAGLTKTGNQLDVQVGTGIAIVSDTVTLASTVAGSGLSFAAGVLTVGGTTNRITTTTTTVDIASTYVGQTSITTLGTIATGTWNGTDIAVTAGGTGLSTLTARGALYGNGTSAVGITAASAIDGSFLREDAAGNPYWSNVVDGGTY